MGFSVGFLVESRPEIGRHVALDLIDLLAGIGHGGGRRFDAGGVGHALQHPAFGEGGLHVAEVALHLLVFTEVVLAEHPHDARQHDDTRYREDNVERLLVAVGLVGGCHGFLQITFTPKALHNAAQGRVSAPWDLKVVPFLYPEGVAQSESRPCATPSG